MVSLLPQLFSPNTVPSVYPQQEIPQKSQICCHQFDSPMDQADSPISGHISLSRKHLEAHSTLYQTRMRLTGIMECIQMLAKFKHEEIDSNLCHVKH